MLFVAALAAPTPTPGTGLPVQLVPSDALDDATAVEELEATEPIAANYELWPEVHSFDVPLRWEHTTPASRPNQTAAPARVHAPLFNSLALFGFREPGGPKPHAVPRVSDAAPYPRLTLTWQMSARNWRPEELQNAKAVG